MTPDRPTNRKPQRHRPPRADDRGTEVRYHYTARLPALLEEAGCGLLVSTYQAGQLVAIGVTEG